VTHLTRMSSTVMTPELAPLMLELRGLLTGPEPRQAKAARAAAAIAKAGRYRWVGLYDVGPADIRIIGWAGPSAPTYPVFPRNQGLNGAAVESGAPLIVQDVRQDVRYLTTFGSTRAEMIMPVRVKADGAVVGTLDVESERVQAFTNRDRDLLSACAAALAELWRGPL
jgi:L-methionine (R)-S-oxide reductase